MSNRQYVVQFQRIIPNVILLDIGTQPIILWAIFASQGGVVGDKVKKSTWHIQTVGGEVESMLEETIGQVLIWFTPRTANIEYVG